MSDNDPDSPDRRDPEVAAGQRADQDSWTEQTAPLQFGPGDQPGEQDHAGQHRAPHQGEDQYGTSQYGQTQYGQTQYGQTQYGQTQYGQTQYGPQYGASYPAYDPYGQYNQYAGGYPSGQEDPYQQYAAPTSPSSGGARPSGWVWPVVAVIALVVGVIGGTMGGVLVSAVSEGGSSGATPSVFEDSAPAPLDPENGSVAAVAEALLPSTVQILTRGGSGPAGSATGSGFVIDRDGHIVTNNHVVAGAAAEGEIEVVDHSGRRMTATIVGRSPVYDIAVLQVEEADELRAAALGSSQSMNIGETVIALGSPLGLSSTVTSGIVSAIDRPVTTGDQDESSYINAVQTDAAINPGNSGGPLVNLRGEVVGVNSAIATVGGFGGGNGNIGVGFAIPMEQVKVTASQIMETGEAQYPVIGANVNTGSRRNGAEIVEVPANTPADEAGLEEGDIVVAVEDKSVGDGIGLIVAIRSHQPGETISLTVRRGGRERTLDITLDGKVG